MMRVLVILAVAVSAVQLHQSSQMASQANPIRRIVNLLQKMQDEVAQEGKAEEKLFFKYHCYCENGAKDLADSINGAGEKAKQLKADIEAKTARKAALDEEVKQHRQDREEAQEAMQQAEGIRKKEKEAYDEATGDFQQNLAAMNKAIEVLSKGMSLLQAKVNTAVLIRAVQSSTAVVDMERQEVMSFLSTKSPYGDYQASSGEIVGILKAMKDEMDKDLGGAVKTEENAVKGFEELMAAKKAEIEAATAGIEKKVVRAGELAVEITEDKNSLGNNGKELEADREFLANLDKNCATKKKEYEARVEERNQELLAISEAIKVLNDMMLWTSSRRPSSRPARLVLCRSCRRTLAPRCRPTLTSSLPPMPRPTVVLRWR
jgi:hypothetical protein